MILKFDKSQTFAVQTPTWLERACGRFPCAAERYFTLDLRSLALVRIYLGLLLSVDLLRRVPHLRTWYTNEGPLPNHMLLGQGTEEYQFSLFYLASHTHEAALLFALCAVVFALFTAGYRTKLMHVLSFVCICSLHNRLTLFEDGAEVSTRLLTFWTMFLPLGARCSFDALCVRRAATADVATIQASPRCVSLVVPAILLQVALVYFFNALHKDGATWREGSAVHYVLHQDSLVTWLGWQVRPYVSPALSRVLSYLALGTEALLPPLLLSPIGTKITRRVAIVLAIGLHIGFASLLNLGMFSFNMIGFFLLFLSDRDWSWLARLPHARLTRYSEGAALWLLRRSAKRDAHGRGAFAKQLPHLREGLALASTLALGTQMLVENQSVPEWLRVEKLPNPLRMMVEYPRLYQEWSMFAPEVQRKDFHMYVDAVTVTGQHVDPLNRAASRISEVPLAQIPEWLDQDDGWVDYIGNVVDVPELLPGLSRFVRAYPERTGDERDRIVSFEVWVLEDESPPPGEREPRDRTRRLLLKESVKSTAQAQATNSCN